MSASRLFSGLHVLAFALVLSAGGCADSVPLAGPQFVAAKADRAYRMDTGDQVKVTVFGEDNLSGQFEVNAAGQVPLPLVGDQQAKGLTLQEFKDQVSRRLAQGYLNNPKVSVEILNYRPIYVHGEVRSGGEFKYKTGISLRDAIAMAGGYTYRANQNVVYIARGGNSEAAVSTATGLSILPGDNIRIPERFF